MENIEIVTRETTFTLEKPLKASMMAMPSLIGKIFEEIIEHLKKSDSAPTYAPFVKYRNLKWDELNRQNKFLAFIKVLSMRWDMIVGFPVSEDSIGSFDIAKGKIPEGKYLRAIHKGPYQKVGDTYKKMITFSDENNLRMQNESIEFYLNDPRTTSQNDLETEVLIPLIS